MKGLFQGRVDVVEAKAPAEKKKPGPKPKGGGEAGGGVLRAS